jgi:chromosome segregation ATPase
MEAKQFVQNSMKVVLHDVDRATALIENVQSKLNEMDRQLREKTRLLEMQNQLREVQTRLEGIKRTIAACQHRLKKDLIEREDIDVWL